jgi:hypothetical protein
MAVGWLALHRTFVGEDLHPVNAARTAVNGEELGAELLGCHTITGRIDRAHIPPKRVFNVTGTYSELTTESMSRDA